MKRWIFLLMLIALMFCFSAVSCGDDDDDDDDGDEDKDFISTKSTDEDGNVTFTDNQSGSRLGVRVSYDLVDDEIDEAPLEGIWVQIHDHSDFELYFIEDPTGTYLPQVVLWEQCESDSCKHFRRVNETDSKIDYFYPDYSSGMANEVASFLKYIIEAGTADGCFSDEQLNEDPEMQLYLLDGPGERRMVMNLPFSDESLDTGKCYERWSYQAAEPLGLTLYYLKESDCCET
jgi:hypothetical protein